MRYAQSPTQRKASSACATCRAVATREAGATCLVVKWGGVGWGLEVVGFVSVCGWRGSEWAALVFAPPRQTLICPTTKRPRILELHGAEPEEEVEHHAQGTKDGGGDAAEAHAPEDVAEGRLLLVGEEALLSAPVCGVGLVRVRGLVLGFAPILHV